MNCTAFTKTAMHESGRINVLHMHRKHDSVMARVDDNRRKDVLIRYQITKKKQILFRRKLHAILENSNLAVRHANQSVSVTLCIFTIYKVTCGVVFNESDI